MHRFPVDSLSYKICLWVWGTTRTSPAGWVKKDKLILHEFFFFCSQLYNHIRLLHLAFKAIGWIKSNTSTYNTHDNIWPCMQNQPDQCEEALLSFQSPTQGPTTGPNNSERLWSLLSNSHKIPPHFLKKGEIPNLDEKLPETCQSGWSLGSYLRYPGISEEAACCHQPGLAGEGMATLCAS